MYALLTLVRRTGGGGGDTVAVVGEGKPLEDDHEALQSVFESLTPSASATTELPNLQTSTAYSGDWTFLFDTGVELAKLEHTIKEGEKEKEQSKENEEQVKGDHQEASNPTGEKGKEKEEEKEHKAVSPNRDDVQIRNFFGLDASEEIIDTFPCSLLRETVVHGMLYMTESHFCYFASFSVDLLPGHEGYLSVKEPYKPAKKRWCVLKGRQLTLFTEPKMAPFCPKRIINLKDIIEVKENNLFESEGGGGFLSFKGNKKDTTFEITYYREGQQNDTQKITLEADDRVSLQLWVESIGELLNAAKAKSTFIVLPLAELEMESVRASSFALDTLKVIHKSSEHLFLLQNIDTVMMMWQEHKRAKRDTRTSTIVREEEISSPFVYRNENKDQEKQKKQENEKEKEKENQGGIRDWLPSKVAIGNITIYSSDKEKKPKEGKTQQDKGDEKHQIRFRKRFNLPNETYLTYYYCALYRTLPLQGVLYITENYICFFSKIGGTTYVVIPIASIRSLERTKYLFRPSLTITTTDFQEVLFVAFMNVDDVYARIYSLQQRVNKTEERQTEEENSTENRENKKPVIISQYRKAKAEIQEQEIQQFSQLQRNLLSEKQENFMTMTGHVQPMNVKILTIGSRGDVQPFIAFAKGMKRAGHTVTIVTHDAFKGFVEGHDLNFLPMGGDPRLLMELCVSSGMFTRKFIQEASAKFRGFVDDLFRDAWKACKENTDAIIAAPSVLGAYHIAERLKVPFFSAFTMPFSRTQAFPHPFISPEKQFGGSFNYMSYLMVEQMLWLPLFNQLNAFRKDVLGLPTIHLGQGGGKVLHERRVPFLYCFSQTVVPKPPDWPDWINLTGYWFLDNPDTNWTPPADLVEFINAGSPPIYIGFGSIIVEDPDALTKKIVDAVRMSGQRAILAKGWGGIGDKAEIPKDIIFELSACPHDWLFPQMSAVVHHGGAGTTAAGLRAGKPTVIVSFFGDQYFWGDRVRDLGVGSTIRMQHLTTENFCEALLHTADPITRSKAEAIGEKLRSEDGVKNAIETFHAYLSTAVPKGF